MVGAIVLCLAVIFGDSVFCVMDHPNNNHGLLRGKEYAEHSARMIKRQIPIAQNPTPDANQAKEAVSELMENIKNGGGNFFKGNGEMSPPPMQSSLMQ